MAQSYALSPVWPPRCHERWLLRCGVESWHRRRASHRHAHRCLAWRLAVTSLDRHGGFHRLDRVLILLVLLSCQPASRLPEGLDRLCEPVDLTIPPGFFLSSAPSIWMENPDSGAQLSVSVLAPEEPLGWTVVLVPPGVEDSSVLDTPARGLVEAGAVVVVFDPDGRGRSEGEEDYGGLVHQAGLGQAISLTAQLPCTDRIGVMSRSMGVSMATGLLSAQPELPVSFLIDWEGPSDRYSTGCQGNTLELPGCEDDFWIHREGAVSIVDLPMPYHRLQTLYDHVQPDAAHARVMLEAALEGGVPGVYFNDVELTEVPASLAPLLQDWRDPMRHPEVWLRWADRVAP